MHFQHGYIHSRPRMGAVTHQPADEAAATAWAALVATAGAAFPFLARANLRLKPCQFASAVANLAEAGWRPARRRDTKRFKVFLSSARNVMAGGTA